VRQQEATYMDNQNVVTARKAAAAEVSAVMSTAEYYAEFLSTIVEEDRDELKLAIEGAAHIVNTYYIFDDNSELRINRDGETEVTYVAHENKCPYHMSK
jgi:hypothetical protein